MNKLIPAFQIMQNNFVRQPSTIGFLYGDRSVYPTATLVASEVIKHHHPVVFIDAANRVDPYYLARLARYQQLDPDAFLQNAYVTRANTFYQLDVAINDGLLEFMQTIHAHSLMMFGPIDLIDDEQVPTGDINDIFRRMSATLDALRAHHISTLMVSTLPHFQLQTRERYLCHLQHSANIIYKLETMGGYQQLTIEQGIRHGTNTANGYHASPNRRSKLVKLPEGAQKRRPENSG